MSCIADPEDCIAYYEGLGCYSETPSPCDGGTFCLNNTIWFDGPGSVTITGPLDTEKTYQVPSTGLQVPACFDGYGEYSVDTALVPWSCYSCGCNCPTSEFDVTNICAGTYYELPNGSIVRNGAGFAVGPSAISGTNDTWYFAGEGNYTLNHCDGILRVVDCSTPTPTPTATATPAPPVANFTGTPTSGTRPLTVQFTDTSTGSPTSWLWDFGDGVTSELQNPQYTYTEPRCCNVRLTVTNSAGSDTELKGGYISVTGHYYVYADGVSLYHGYEGNLDLTYANKTATDFYEYIDGRQGTEYHSIVWEGLANPVDDATGSRNWDINEDANSMANNADFAYHAGHGWEDGIMFGTANPDYKLYRSDMQFGGNNGRAKWVVFDSCHVLDQSTQSNWESVFDGLHILMGFDTIGLESEHRGSQFAERMTGTGSYMFPSSIRVSWKKTLQNTIDDDSYRGAYMWAEPSGDDFLPGFGTFSKPVKDGSGQYTIYWENFVCKEDD